MSIIYINSYQFAAAPPSGYDPGAQAYITAVEAADAAAGSPGGLETAVKDAINAFVVGCKADGIWSAIKASCILAGARTLDGALVPLAGTAPTNFNFVSGDYDRKTGLVGNGTTKYLDSNRPNNADPQNNCHVAVYGYYTGNYGGIIGTGSNSAVTRMIQQNSSTSQGFKANNSVITNLTNSPYGFLGVSRLSPAEFVARSGSLSTPVGEISSAPRSDVITVFRRGSILSTGLRLAFYSIGEALDLALLDSRVTTLINAFAAAIP